VRFWDTSGIVPLLLEQEATSLVRPVMEEDPRMVAWWGTPVECASVAARLRREGILTVGQEDAVLRLLGTLRESWVEVLPSSELRAEAMRLLRVHSLKAADAVQLAAALLWTGPDRDADMVTLDERLSLAARLEGLRVLP
jgi:uncharacterized protein